jgi:flagellar FliL protein
VTSSGDTATLPSPRPPAQPNNTAPARTVRPATDRTAPLDRIMSDEATPAKDKSTKEKKGVSPVLLVLLLLVGLGGGLGIAKVTGGSKGSGPAVEPPPEPGEVAVIESINVNLAGGHFLRIGVGAQLTKEVTAKPEEWAKTDGAIVRDVIVDVFSGQPMAELESAEGRKHAVETMTERSIEATEKEVMKIYLTEFVMQ